MPLDKNAQAVQHVVNQVTAKILENCDDLASQGLPRELFLTGLIFAVANLSKDLGVPTAKLGISVSQARQTVDNNLALAKRPT